MSEITLKEFEEFLKHPPSSVTVAYMQSMSLEEIHDKFNFAYELVMFYKTRKKILDEPEIRKSRLTVFKGGLANG